MRYANSKRSHKGIGVEPNRGRFGDTGDIEICDDQHQNVIRHASVINGWGAIK